MKNTIFKIIIIIFGVMTVLCFIPQMIEYKFKYHYSIGFMWHASSTIFCGSLGLYMLDKRKYFVLLIIIPLHFVLRYALGERAQLHQNELRENQTFYLNTGTIGKTHYYDKYESYPLITCGSMQSGREREFSGMQEKDDTIIVKMSLDDFIICVYKDDPSPVEIQKYMEPVLFIDGVEQPRPEYDDLKLSDEERRDLLREHHIEVARVVKKERDKFLRNLVTLQVNDTLQKTVNLMYKDEPDYEDIFESLNENSYVIVNVSDINPKVVEVTDWQPTAKDVDKYNVKSYLMLATVISKKSEETKQAKHSMIYYAKLRINDKTETSFLRVRGLFQSDRQEYESLKEGDTVLINLTEGKAKTVSVVDWQPTPEEIEKYKTPVRLIEKN